MDYTYYLFDFFCSSFYVGALDMGYCLCLDGEPCTGSLKIEGENITCPEAITPIGYYLELLDSCDNEEGKEHIKEFVAKFLPEGVPTFTLTVKNENYWNIVANGVIVGKKFAYPEKDEAARVKEEAAMNETIA